LRFWVATEPLRTKDPPRQHLRNHTHHHSNTTASCREKHQHFSHFSLAYSLVQPCPQPSPGTSAFLLAKAEPSPHTNQRAERHILFYEELPIHDPIGGSPSLQLEGHVLHLASTTSPQLSIECSLHFMWSLLASCLSSRRPGWGAIRLRRNVGILAYRSFASRKSGLAVIVDTPIWALGVRPVVTCSEADVPAATKPYPPFGVEAALEAYLAPIRSPDDAISSCWSNQLHLEILSIRRYTIRLMLGER
jgi:hypothetical protein